MAAVMVAVVAAVVAVVAATGGRPRLRVPDPGREPGRAAHRGGGGGGDPAAVAVVCNVSLQL